MTAPAFTSKWLDWTPKTPSQRTDTPDSLQTVGTVGSLDRHSEVESISPVSLTAGLQEQFRQRAAVAEFEGGLSRIDAELLAWDEIRTCLQCRRDTQCEADALRVSGGGWLHLDKCYDGYFGFRDGQS